MKKWKISSLLDSCFEDRSFALAFSLPAPVAKVSRSPQSASQRGQSATQANYPYITKPLISIYSQTTGRQAGIGASRQNGLR